MTFEASYLGQLRQVAGNRQLVVPAARAIIFNEAGELLLIKRADNGWWGMPAGAIELNESILDCLKREVREECGLQVVSATAIAIYSEPRFVKTNLYGQTNQMFAIVFRVDEWRGDVIRQTDETTDARFFPLDRLPAKTVPHYHETLADLAKFDGKLILK